MPKRRIPGSARNGIVPQPPIVRLRARLRRDAETGCDVWTGALDRKGYARIAVGGHRSRLAHRVAYEASLGPIPVGLTLDHLCRNKACCNPAHLEPVTSSENTRRKAHPTLCPAGHEMTGENVRFDRGGTTRRCRACDRERQRAKRRSGVGPSDLTDPQSQHSDGGAR